MDGASRPTPQASAVTDMPAQADYRQNPSLNAEPAQGHVSRDDPYPTPWQHVSPGLDDEIVNYDLPHEPHTYNQMSLGLSPTEVGWSRDSYAASNPDVNPRGR